MEEAQEQFEEESEVEGGELEAPGSDGSPSDQAEDRGAALAEDIETSADSETAEVKPESDVTEHMAETATESADPPASNEDQVAVEAASVEEQLSEPGEDLPDGTESSDSVVDVAEPAPAESEQAEADSEQAEVDSELTEADSAQAEADSGQAEVDSELTEADSEQAEVDSEQAEAVSGEIVVETAPDEVEEAQVDPALEAEQDLAPAVKEPDDGRLWYVVHCYSGYENKVRHNLEQRIETMNMKGKIFDVVVPTEEEMEVREGKRRTVERRVFPGYILVQMLMDEDSWYVVRNTPGVTGFVGMGNDPTPLRPEEVSQIIKRMEAEAPRIKVTYKIGQKVRIIDGPFNDFIGTVDDIDMDKAKVRVRVSFFGRETPVELDFLQVEKA